MKVLLNHREARIECSDGAAEEIMYLRKKLKKMEGSVVLAADAWEAVLEALQLAAQVGGVFTGSGGAKPSKKVQRWNTLIERRSIADNKLFVRVLDAVCEGSLEATPDKILSPCRTHGVAFARHTAVYLMRNKIGRSATADLFQICLSNVDYAVQQVRARLETTNFKLPDV